MHPSVRTSRVRRNPKSGIWRARWGCTGIRLPSPRVSPPVASMSDARRARAERRAALTTHVAQTAPVGGCPCCSPSPVVNAATGLVGNEQQASSLHPLVRREGRTATASLTPAGSSSHARRAPTDAHTALLLARELLHYRPVDDLYEDWLAHITELVSAAGGSPAPSFSLPRPPSCVGDAAQEAPPPPPPQ